MSLLRVFLIAVGAVVVSAAALAWYVIGRLVVGYAKLDAEERIEELAPRRNGRTE